MPPVARRVDNGDSHVVMRTSGMTLANDTIVLSMGRLRVYFSAGRQRAARNTWHPVPQNQWLWGNTYDFVRNSRSTDTTRR